MATGKHQKMKKQDLKPYNAAMLFGTFDPLHYGHIRLIKRAKKLADFVIVATDSDDLIRDAKQREPFSCLEDRIDDLTQIKGADLVVVESHEHNKKYWIDFLKPDVLIKGDDWKGKGWSGEGLGVEVVYLPHTEGVNSTMLRK